MQIGLPETELQKTIVISDIHMSDGQNYSWFLPPCPEEVIALLHRVASDASVEELVLLGDVFDLWLYPLDVVPWTVSQIIGGNPAITQALRQCVQNIANVYYLNGNHDLEVKAAALQPFSSGGKSMQWITPEWYQAKHQGRRHLEHGHGVDMFNGPDDSGDTIGGYPLGFFITRLVASAPDRRAAGQALKELLQTRSAALGAMTLDEIDVRALGPELVRAIVDLLEIYAGVDDITPMRFSEPELDQKFTVGDIKNHYGSLLDTWFKRFPNPVELAKTMVVTVIPTGLNWYAQKLLSGSSPPKVVVMGHTHHALTEGAYDNDGCWCLSSSWGHGDATSSYVEIIGDQATLVFGRQPG
jgi:UDP-2,3-diacylglucosamine pyrophosphatase LpxH